MDKAMTQDFTKEQFLLAFDAVKAGGRGFKLTAEGGATLTYKHIDAIECNRKSFDICEEIDFDDEECDEMLWWDSDIFANSLVHMCELYTITDDWVFNYDSEITIDYDELIIGESSASLAERLCLECSYSPYYLVYDEAEGKKSFSISGIYEEGMNVAGIISSPYYDDSIFSVYNSVANRDMFITETDKGVSYYGLLTEKDKEREWALLNGSKYKTITLL